jgi:hypothetical protein
VSRTSWFKHALSTRDGGEYSVDDIAVNPALGNAPVATYATAIRSGGEERGDVMGALGIFFDWGPQAQAIVEGVRLSSEEWERTRCLLLDADGLVIAASDRRGVLDERVSLAADGADTGYYTDPSGAVVGYSLTPGYETYAGLGWYGVIQQKPVRL